MPCFRLRAGKRWRLTHDRRIEITRTGQNGSPVEKKNAEEKYIRWVLHMGKISRVISQKEKEIKDEIKRKRANKPQARELVGQEELHDAERQMWQESFDAELRTTEKKIEIETASKASLAKPPQMKVITIQRNSRGLGNIWKLVPYENSLHQFLMKKNQSRRNMDRLFTVAYFSVRSSRYSASYR